MSLDVRAFYRSIQVENCTAPYDTISLKVYYPAQYEDSDEERNTGVLPADSKKAPFPIVILMPGINVGAEAYAWLATSLCKDGNVVIAYSWIAEEMPGYVSLTPGLSMQGLTPDGHGKAPSCPALAPLLAEISSLNTDGILAGLLDISRIYLGGHSAGGTMALLNANPAWFPAIQGVFSYGAHTGASVALGWPNDTVLNIPKDIPALLIGGTADQVIASSSHRYGLKDDDSPTYRIQRTFDEAVSSGNGSALIFINGANHFTFAYPHDSTTGRPFLDGKETIDGNEARALISHAITSFINNTISTLDIDPEIATILVK